jgi:hypothetical protein
LPPRRKGWAWKDARAHVWSRPEDCQCGPFTLKNHRLIPPIPAVSSTSAPQTPREVPGKCEVRKLQHKVNEPSARIVPMRCHSFPRELRPRPLRLVAPSHHLVTPNPLECALEVTSCVSAWLDPV